MATQGLANPHLREGLKILRKIISTHPNLSPSSTTALGLTTSELYKLALKEKPSQEFSGWRQWTGRIRGPRTGTTAQATAASSRRSRPTPASTLQSPIPPHPEHPIRSMSYLKQEILPVLEGSKEIKIIRATRLSNPAAPTNTSSSKSKPNKKTSASSTIWVWKAIDKSTLPRPPAPEIPREVIGAEVGLGADWTHLNRRRLRARKTKVYQEVGIARKLDAQRKVAQREAETADTAE